MLLPKEILQQQRKLILISNIFNAYYAIKRLPYILLDILEQLEAYRRLDVMTNTARVQSADSDCFYIYHLENLEDRKLMLFVSGITSWELYIWLC